LHSNVDASLRNISTLEVIGKMLQVLKASVADITHLSASSLQL